MDSFIYSFILKYALSTSFDGEHFARQCGRRTRRVKIEAIKTTWFQDPGAYIILTERKDTV